MGQKAIVKEVTKINDRELVTVTNKFMAQYPRYDSSHVAFDPTARRLPKRDATKALLDSQEKHTLEVPLGKAKRMKTKVAVAVRDIRDIGLGTSNQFSQNEARKIIAGNIVQSQSHNMRTVRGVYKGTRNSISHDNL